MFIPILALALSLPDGQIAFLQGTEQIDRCVAIVDIQTKHVTRVGFGHYDGAPVWSPNGDMLAFETQRDDGSLAIALATVGGAQPEALTHATTSTHWPAWSPEGKLLAYAGGDGLDTRIYVYDRAAKTETSWGGDAIRLTRPQWSGDGRMLAIGLVGEADAMTTDLYWVTPTEAIAAHELKASNGPYTEWGQTCEWKNRAVAYESNDGGDREIFAFIPKYGAIDVSNHRGADWNPTWSPDGITLAFESFREGRRGIYKVNPFRLLVSPICTDPIADNWAPSWAPDGNWLAFISNRSGIPRLYICESNGESVAVVTPDGSSDLAPAWRPVKAVE